MTIDWVTVSAQVINFLVLVYLLKRFLYRPVLDAMDSRERRIAEHLREAKEKSELAEEEANHYRRAQQQLEERKKELLDQARQDADAERRQCIESARAEVDETREKWIQELKREQDEFIDKLKKEAARGMADALRHVVEDLSGSRLEASMVSVFLERLEGMAREQRKALEDAGGAVIVRTAFGLEDALKDRIRKEVAQAIGTADIEFAEAPELICGIELQREGTKVEWTANRYLNLLEQRLLRALGDAGSGG